MLYFTTFPFECRPPALTNDFRVLLLNHFILLTNAEVMACPGFAFYLTVLGFSSICSQPPIAFMSFFFCAHMMFPRTLLVNYLQCLSIYFPAWQYPFQFPINLFDAPQTWLTAGRRSLSYITNIQYPANAISLYIQNIKRWQKAWKLMRCWGEQWWWHLVYEPTGLAWLC